MYYTIEFYTEYGWERLRNKFNDDMIYETYDEAEDSANSLHKLNKLSYEIIEHDEV